MPIRASAARWRERCRRLTGTRFESAADKFEGLAAQDDAVELSGQLSTLAVALMKIANDLRWMNSGPLAGLGEIELPALQPGSSIMPGKVNPVIPESVAMVCAQVMGHHTAITVAGQSGNFQLNVMLPLIAYDLLDSIRLLANSMRLLADSAIAGLRARRSACARRWTAIRSWSPRSIRSSATRRPRRSPSRPTRKAVRCWTWRWR